MRRAPADKVRLQKFLSDAGVASRRHAEDLILEGRVLVNNRVVDALPAFVDPAKDKVVANGVPVRVQRHEYFLVHKPKGVVCTNHDPGGRTRAVDLLPVRDTRLFPVGRLDVESTGLLVMTNDGELAQQITHPRYGVPKTYRAEVRGKVPPDLPAQLKKGVYLSDGKAHASEVEVVHASRQRSVLMITLREGRNRQVRRMLARLEFPVRTLKRVQIGSLSLRALPVGAARRLTPKELAILRQEFATAASMATSAPRKQIAASPRRRRSMAGNKKLRRPARSAEREAPRTRTQAVKRSAPSSPTRRIIS